MHIYGVCTVIRIVKGNNNIDEDSNNSNNNKNILTMDDYISI